MGQRKRGLSAPCTHACLSLLPSLCPRPPPFHRPLSLCSEPKIYIHCTAGMGRAPATACIYLVKYHGYGLDHARDHVKHHRPIVAPNYNAMKLAIQNGLD